jgi:hypothetical protein
MNLVVTITQTQIFNPFIYNFSFQGYLKLYLITRVKSKPFHKCCIFPTTSKEQYVLTMICHGHSQVDFYTNEMEKTLNTELKTLWGGGANTITWATPTPMGLLFGLFYSWNIPQKVSKKIFKNHDNFLYIILISLALKFCQNLSFRKKNY